MIRSVKQPLIAEIQR